MDIKTNLDGQQKNTLQKLFRQRTFLEPHVVAQHLRLKRIDAIALLDKLVQEYPKHFTRKYFVYHYCSDAPVTSIPDTKTIKPGWVCPECGEEVELCSLTMEFAYSAIAPVEFLELENGAVRYWHTVRFPYYTKEYQDGVEPALTLLSGDAEMFDAVLESHAIAREQDLVQVDRKYREVIGDIARDLM